MALAGQEKTLFDIVLTQAGLCLSGNVALDAVQHTDMTAATAAGKRQDHTLAQKSLQQGFISTTLISVVFKLDVVHKLYSFLGCLVSESSSRCSPQQGMRIQVSLGMNMDWAFLTRSTIDLKDSRTATCSRKSVLQLYSRHTRGRFSQIAQSIDCRSKLMQ
jgi:hypothetical protein